MQPRHGRSARLVVLVAGVMLAVVVVGGLALWVVPALLTRPAAGMSAAERLRAANDVRTPVIAFLVAVGAGATSVFTARSYVLNREGHVTDRYTKAVGQLGDPQSSVRVGGLYALERIGHDSGKDRTTIIYVLGVFIREHSKQPPRGRDDPLPEDVYAAIRIASRLLRRSDAVLQLRGADLHGADLSFLRADQVRLDGADLTGALPPAGPG
jgi:Pentapeptide repeats (8 copies)